MFFVCSPLSPNPTSPPPVFLLGSSHPPQTNPAAVMPLVAGGGDMRPSKILVLLNMVTPEELVQDDEYNGEL